MPLDGQGRRNTGGRLLKVACNNYLHRRRHEKIMESCQDLGCLIIACTIMCVLQIVCLCLLKKARNVLPRLSRPYADRDTHGLIRKHTGNLNGKKMDSVQGRISRKQPSNITNNHFNQVGFMTKIIDFNH